MTKKLDENAIMNELRGNSAFFKTEPLRSSEEQLSERPVYRTEHRSEDRSNALPVKRRTKRYSFEFYDDQIIALKKLKRGAEDRGESLTLSDMAREAFDNYLKRTEIRTNKRTD